MSTANSLSLAQEEALHILIEECGEVIQAATKILRHGYSSYNPTIIGGETNRQALEREVGDLGSALDRLDRNGDIDMDNIIDHEARKSEKVKQYLHYNVN